MSAGELLPFASESPQFFGREQLLERLEATGPGLVIVYGDSGVGKSALMRRIADPSSPIMVHSYAGSLVNSLMEQLAIRIADTPIRSNGRGIGNALRTAVASAAGSSTKEVVVFLGKQLAALVRARWGEGAAEMLEGFIDSTASDVGDALQSKLAAAMQPEAPAAFVELAGKVVEVLGDIHLILDSGPFLSSADIEVLESLPLLLPGRITITMAMTVSNADEAQTVQRLQMAGARLVEVAPLHRDGLRHWLQCKGFHSSLLDELALSTGGYPLFVETALSALQAGEALVNQLPPEAFVARTKRARQALDNPGKRALQRLAYFTYPLEDEAACIATGLSAEEWSVTREQFVDARLFSPADRNRLWFHDRKRRVLLETLSEADRHVYATGVLEAIWDNVEKLSYEHFSDLANIADGLPASKLPQSARGAMQISRQALACFHALVELRELVDGDPGFVITSAVLHHAGRKLGSHVSLLSLEELVSADLAFIHSDGRASVTALTVDHAQYALLMGRCVNTFSAFPFPSVASALVRGVITPRLYGYSTMQFGVGDESVSGLPDVTDSRWYKLEPPPWGLTLRVRLGDRLIFTHACFTSEEARDQASLDFSDFPSQFFGEDVRVEFNVKTPAASVPSTRFIRAWNLASRTRLSANSLGPPARTMVSIEEAAGVYVRLRALMRGRSGNMERFATGLMSPVSYAYTSEAGSVIMGELIDPDERPIPCRIPPNTSFDSATFDVEFAQYNELPVGSRLRNRIAMSQGLGGIEHPAARLVLRTTQKATEFNRDFARPLEFGDLEDLQQMLRDSMITAYADAAAMLDAGVIPDPVDDIYETSSFELVIHQEPTGWFEKPQFVGHVIKYPAEMSTIEVRLMEHADAFRRLSEVREQDRPGTRLESYSFASDMLESYLSLNRKELDDRSLRTLLGIAGDYRVLC